MVPAEAAERMFSAQAKGIAPEQICSRRIASSERGDALNIRRKNMRKFALVLASVAGFGFAAPAFASDNDAAAPRLQLAQLGVSVNVGTPGVVVRDRHYHRRHHHHRRHYHSHRAQGDVVIVKKRKPARKTVIIDRR
jgi:hypothetical protein